MYHRVYDSKDDQKLIKFKKHLEQLVSKYAIVVPGDELVDKVSVCLTFDDATYDFYKYVFPLLQQYNIKAVLGVPTTFITAKATLSDDERLEMNFAENGQYDQKESCCTWQELTEMAASGHVILASHSHNHVDLRKDKTKIDYELNTSKKYIQQNTGFTPSIFIYPYGKSNMYCVAQVQKHYKYGMRIGRALNLDWRHHMYRICARKFCENGSMFGLLDLCRWTWVHWQNRLRFK